MAKQASRMMIGGFVVLAVIIMAASLVVFGSGKFFKKTNKYILYFDEPVNGLTVGAPVLFQGVQVGSVTSITLQADFVTMKTQIPILIEVDPERWKVRTGERDYHKVAAKLIEMGLRAQLITQSFITGQLMIQLDFFPKSKICYAPAQIDPDYQDLVVIPTCASTSERIAKAFGELDLKGIEKNLNASLAGIDRLVNNPDLAASIRALKDTLQDASKLLAKVDRQVDPVSDDVKKTVKEFGKLAANIDARIAGLVANFDKTMSGFDKTMAAARGVLSPDSPLMVNLEETLKEFSAMSRSIRQLTNYLDQHPEALIRGKGNPGGK
jgi:paraquat-inducible protein B